MPDFYKYHGLGNDYLVLDPARFPFHPSPEAVRAVCDRNFGVGSDGILLGPLPGSGPQDRFSLRIFNPDGGEAEKSGNGLRIFSWYLFEQGYVDAGPFPVRTLSGLVSSRIVDPAAKQVEVNMGPANFDARNAAPSAQRAEILDQPYTFAGESCRISFVSMGNPHCVILGQAVNEALARRLGPVVECSPLFPAKTNVQFLEVLSPSEIRIQIWERGAGYTLASGSSSCAAAAVARRLGLVGDEVSVRMPGGVLKIAFQQGSVWLTGPVAKVMEGTFAEELAARIRN